MRILTGRAHPWPGGFRTAENIALVIHESLATEVANRSGAEVVRVKIIETRNNSCTSGALA